MSLSRTAHDVVQDRREGIDERRIQPERIPQSFAFVSYGVGEITFRRVHYQEFNERFADRLFDLGKTRAISNEDLSRLLKQ